MWARKICMGVRNVFNRSCLETPYFVYDTPFILTLVFEDEHAVVVHLNFYTVRTSLNVLPALSHSCFTVPVPPLSLCITELHHYAHLFSIKLELLP